MLDSTKELELLNALQSAEKSGEATTIEGAVNNLALYYVVTNQFLAAVPFWRRGASLLARSTAPDSRELATYLHNMVALCLIPAGLDDEARVTLLRAKEIYARHFKGDAQFVCQIDELLRQINI